MKTFLYTLSTVALLSGATVSIAQPGGGILRMDSDGDGKISREEFQPPGHRRGPRLFERADSNDDGVITRDEVLATGEERQSRMLEKFTAMDGNGDGQLTQDEAVDHLFAQLDANSDGFVTSDEARAMHERRRDKRGERGDADS